MGSPSVSLSRLSAMTMPSWTVWPVPWRRFGTDDYIVSPGASCVQIITLTTKKFFGGFETWKPQWTVFHDWRNGPFHTGQNVQLIFGRFGRFLVDTFRGWWN